MSIFDLNDPHAFFHSIKYQLIQYEEETTRSTEDILYVIMGLNHLREWIAPDYKFDNTAKVWPAPKTEAEAFSKRIYDTPEFKIVRSLCNQTKHPKNKVLTSTLHGANIDDWKNWDAVVDFDLGPPTRHFVNGIPIEEILRPLVTEYESWFQKNREG